MGLMLWLDDERPAPPGWVRARTATEAITVLNYYDVEALSLDHDLGPPEAGTGYDVIAWLEEQVLVNGFVPPASIKVHSANPVGRQRMLAAIANIQRAR